MSQAVVIYWSQTGNTQAMAEAIQSGMQEAGVNCDLVDVSSIAVEDALNYERIALGCPAMGAEVLEECEFEPFFTALEGRLGGKKVALFGSYGWGDGQWMRDWVERTRNANASLFQDEGLMVHETPDEEALALCKTFGAQFAVY